MTIDISIDLVSIFNDLVIDLTPYAQKQGVILNFKSELKELQYSNISDELISQFSNVITKIINYTPHSFTVEVFLHIDPNKVDTLIINISNTGVNLARIREITNKVNYEFEIKGVKNESTTFKTTISLNQINDISCNSIIENDLGYRPYYKEIENKLSEFFKEIENLQKAADNKGEKAGVFLRTVNAIIQSRMSNNEFKVNALASAMALSRAQLYRKMKVLTKMSPSEYLLYFRLIVERDLIETKRNHYNIGEIGYRVGFISKSHFTRSFYKQFGICPSKYKIIEQ